MQRSDRIEQYFVRARLADDSFPALTDARRCYKFLKTRQGTFRKFPSVSFLLSLEGAKLRFRLRFCFRVTLNTQDSSTCVVRLGLCEMITKMAESSVC